MKDFLEFIGFLSVFVFLALCVIVFIAWLLPIKNDLRIEDNRICQTYYKSFSLDEHEKCFEVKINVENYTMEEYYE